MSGGAQSQAWPARKPPSWLLLNLAVLCIIAERDTLSFLWSSGWYIPRGKNKAHKIQSQGAGVGAGSGELHTG